MAFLAEMIIIKLCTYNTVETRSYKGGSHWINGIELTLQPPVSTALLLEL